MTRCMPPMGHVVDLPDRQYPLGSSRGSCNRNITFTTHTVTTMSRNIYLGTYAFKYSRKYVLMYSSTPYSSTYYSCTHVLMHPVLCTLYTCTRVLCTHALMYLHICTRVLCTHALLYYSSQCTPYCYRHYVYDKHFGLYTVHIWSSK